MKIRKILIYILCCSILSISCVPLVSAHEDNGKNTNFIDLLTADFYSFTIGSTQSQEVYPANFSASSQAVMRWSVPNYSYSGKFYFYVKSTTSFNVVRATGRGDDLNSISVCDLVGSYDDLYLYSWEGRLNGNLYIRFNAPVTSFSFSVVACWLSFNTSVEVDDCFMYTQLYESGYGYSDMIYEGIKYFGVNTSTQYNIGRDGFGVLRLDIPLLDLDLCLIDKFTIIFRTTYLYDVSASLNSMSDFYSIPLLIEQFHFNSTDLVTYPSGGDKTAYTYYSVTVDLSNHDLSNDSYHLSFNIIFKFILDQSSPMYFGRTDVLSCFYNPLLEDVPWYKTFFSWLTKPLNSIIELLRGDNVDDENIIFDNAEEMSTQASILDDFNEQLQMVDRPTIDSESLVQDNILIDTPSMNVMTSVISEDVVAPILIIVCTLALLGYILFGSKGA